MSKKKYSYFCHRSNYFNVWLSSNATNYIRINYSDMCVVSGLTRIRKNEKIGGDKKRGLITSSMLRKTEE